jgi:putative hydrolase of the HAD superfamily
LQVFYGLRVTIGGSNVFCSMKYRHLFFDLDHTLWDFETNAKESLLDVFTTLSLKERGVPDFDSFFTRYSYHNHRLWDKYTRGEIKQDELRWKRMWLALVDSKIADEPLARKMAVDFLEVLPTKNNLFPYTVEILRYLQEKKYALHLITNGFEEVQHNKLKHANLSDFFRVVTTSEASNSLKPNKDIFYHALREAGALIEESIMIGDNLEADIQGGMNTGMDTVFVNHIGAVAHITPTYTITHLQQLEDIF